MATKPTEDSPYYIRAIAFATEKHAKQVRMGGMPYIVHPIAVADIVNCWGYGRDYIIAAFFHDLLEDTDATDEEILEIGGPKVLEAVRALTKSENYVMSEYVEGIMANDIARVVKAADRLHNLRCAVLAPRTSSTATCSRPSTGIWTCAPRSRRRCGTWPPPWSSRSTRRRWITATSTTGRRSRPSRARRALLSRERIRS